MQKKILLLNGPNLHYLGKREPSIYGRQTMEEVVMGLKARFPEVELSYRQSNCEGKLIDLLYEASEEGVTGVVFNAGAYTHTSIALHDAIRAIGVPVIEVHLSNIHQREEFRHHSCIAAACQGVIAGFGTDSYRLGIAALLELFSSSQ